MEHFGMHHSASSRFYFSCPHVDSFECVSGVVTQHSGVAAQPPQPLLVFELMQSWKTCGSLGKQNQYDGCTHTHTLRPHRPSPSAESKATVISLSRWSSAFKTWGKLSCSIEVSLGCHSAHRLNEISSSEHKFFFFFPIKATQTLDKTCCLSSLPLSESQPYDPSAGLCQLCRLLASLTPPK